MPEGKGEKRISSVCRYQMTEETRTVRESYRRIMFSRG